MMEWLEYIDRNLFLAINGWHAPWADEFFSWISYKYFWIPVYLLCVGLACTFYGWKKGLTYTFFIVFTIALADLISVQLFKEVFMRARPCHNTELAPFVHLYQNDCGGYAGFLSSHATNIGALSFWLFMIYKPRLRWVALPLIIWILLIDYSRIYLGRHYPADVITGTMLGIFVAWLISRIVFQFIPIKSESA